MPSLRAGTTMSYDGAADRGRLQALSAGPAGTASAAIGSSRGSAAAPSAWFIAAAMRSWTAGWRSRSRRGAATAPTAFLHEAQNVAGLRHPNLVGLLDYGTAEDGRPYIVYEYIAGRTLAERIAAGDYTLGDCASLDDRLGRGLAGRPSAAHLPSRYQARQHPHRRGGKRPPHRFRPGPPRRRFLSKRSQRVPGDRLRT